MLRLILSFFITCGAVAHAQPRVGDIDDSEITKVERRRKALRLASFGLGPFGSSKIGRGNVLYGFSYGRHWEASTIGEIVAEMTAAFNSRGTMVNGGMGYNLIPLTTEISPVVGAELGLGYGFGWNSDNQRISQGGFTLQGNLGARLMRLAETQMEVMGTYTMVLSDPSPSLYGVQVRVLF